MNVKFIMENVKNNAKLETHPKLIKLSSPEIVVKGWGEEKIIVNNDEFCGKFLIFKEGSEFSTHMHKEKREIFHVISGWLLVTGINTEDASTYTIELTKGDSLEVPRMVFHRIKAIIDSVILEISTSHRDEDSYRISPGDSQKLL